MRVGRSWWRGTWKSRLERSVTITSSSATVRSLFFFFFQAEDGIRDYKVTGVQTCALPIFGRLSGRESFVQHYSHLHTSYSPRSFPRTNPPETPPHRRPSNDRLTFLAKHARIALRRLRRAWSSQLPCGASKTVRSSD